ncbi:hypothetical protein NQ176_g6296 [Zarea fungicola]|uniref:Uncharacterized protein n=1 Tax=Zarea fungicola TaxID=93591 RepID=A0ACC1N690_9HYPO|nr:hypothetical protein NQ176_g6296 [Lecanicillium fungicola]
MVADTAGEGSTQGLPTADDNGVVSLVYRQINQDGAGPLTAAVDGTSGGTDANAFQDADVVQDIPGLGVGGLSLATKTDFPLQVKMPAGMTCDGAVGGATNVCINAVARKRALAYRLKKRMEIVREAAPEVDFGEADAEEELDDEHLEE